METKKCPKCGNELPLTEFYHSKITGKPYTYCKKCSKDIKKEEKEKRKQKEKEDLISRKLDSITSRELIIELRKRGYRGELVFQQKVKI